MLLAQVVVDIVIAVDDIGRAATFFLTVSVPRHDLIHLAVVVEDDVVVKVDGNRPLVRSRESFSEIDDYLGVDLERKKSSLLRLFMLHQSTHLLAFRPRVQVRAVVPSV